MLTYLWKRAIRELAKIRCARCGKRVEHVRWNRLTTGQVVALCFECDYELKHPFSDLLSRLR